jgi:integrase/recombinase XerD
MFEDLFTRPSALAQHRTAPHAEERARYLTHCAQRGESRQTLRHKARELLWVARQLHEYPTLDITIEQVSTAAHRGENCDRPWTERRFVNVARPWLRFLGHLRKPDAPIPFRGELEEYGRWAKNERGLSETTVDRYHGYITHFLRWYGRLARPLADVQASDTDAYLAYGGSHGWSRIAVRNAATALKAFFRYGATRGWCGPRLAETIHGPRLYALERLPAGPDWADVQRLLANTDTDHPHDVRDRAILMLLAIYGLRARSGHAAPRPPRLGSRSLPCRSGQAPRHPGLSAPALSRERDSPLRGKAPATVGPPRGLSHARRAVSAAVARRALRVVGPRLKALGVRTAHRGPHALRHACATHLVAEGVSLKAIGDHLGHRTTAPSRIYAKVDLPSLRAVAAFDLAGPR